MERPAISNRITVKEAVALDISWLRKEGFLVGFRSGNLIWRAGDTVTGRVGVQVTVDDREGLGVVKLTYSVIVVATGEKHVLEYPVKIRATKCNYGGHRWWFLCPAANCGARVGKLYIPGRGEYFACRRCYDLTYDCCQQSNSSLYKLAKARRLKLGQLGRHSK